MAHAFADQDPAPSSQHIGFAFCRHPGKVAGETVDAKMLDSKQETEDGDVELRRRLEAADPATLLLSLVQLTGERHWLEAAKPFIRGPMSYQEFMPESLRASIRDRLSILLAEISRTGTIPNRRADDALLREMMAVAAGESVPDDYIAMMREDLTDDTLHSRSLKW